MMRTGPDLWQVLRIGFRRWGCNDVLGRGMGTLRVGPFVEQGRGHAHVGQVDQNGSLVDE